MPATWSSKVVSLEHSAIAKRLQQNTLTSSSDHRNVLIFRPLNEAENQGHNRSCWLQDLKEDEVVFEEERMLLREEMAEDRGGNGGVSTSQPLKVSCVIQQIIAHSFCFGVEICIICLISSPICKSEP